MARTEKPFNVEKVLESLSINWSFRRREPARIIKWDKSLCPMCLRPKHQCWETGETDQSSNPDLE